MKNQSLEGSCDVANSVNGDNADYALNDEFDISDEVLNDIEKSNSYNARDVTRHDSKGGFNDEAESKRRDTDDNA